MTHAFDNTNGASLEDCHTNFFALADLNGIKWRRLCVDSVFIDPLEDPVLKSYSNCLSAGILTVWRRVLVQRAGIHQTVQESNSLSCFKELWIFWYGEGPDFSGLVESSLTEAEQGSWENGLSYECRTLLFKALHNLIERGLLSRGYTRLGRFFVEPQVLPINKKNGKQIAFSLHFFIHGESTVCASIDSRQASAIYVLDKCHITAAQTGQKNVKVILSPYGMEGKLTGVGYKYNDPHMARFLNNWHTFYLHPHGRANWKLNSEMSSVVEVLIGGARMKYPASYVFVTEEDHLEVFPSFENSPSGDNALPTIQTNFKSSTLPAPGLLTPPMSPAETSTLGDFSRYESSSNHALPKSQIDSIHAANEMDYSNLIIHSVSQECYTSVVREKADDSSALWDFQDHALVANCNCSICTRKHNKLKNSQGLLGRNGSASNAGPYSLASSTNAKSYKNGRMLARVPFHHRSSVMSDVLGDTHSSSKRDSVKPLTIDFRTCPNNASLPQLQSPFTQLKKQSLPVNASSDTYYSHLSSSDPVMPTLSPQPPVIKEEPEEMQTQMNVSSLCRDSSQGVPLKGKISDELLSPFHTSLLNSFENAKLFNKKSPMPLSIEADQGDEDTQADDAIPLNIECQVLEKPKLHKRNHEESEEAELTMNGLLYDYRHYDSPAWYLSSAKTRCLPSNSLGVHKNDLKDSNCDIIENAYELDEIVPCAPKDPYEFTEFDETTPSERGFRQKTELFIKDEKMLPNPPPVNPASVIPATVPVQPPEVMVTHLSEESDKALSPTTKNFCPKFIREEDLAVSLHDLDNIFDTSSSEGEDNGDMPVTPSKLMAYDELSGKIELSRMYPTPPSLEQHAVPSPFGPLTGNDVATSENDAYREEFEMDQSSVMNYEHENIDVWYPPLITEFMESSKYAALLTLPSYIDLKLDQELPLWTHSNSRIRLNSANEDNQLLEVQQVYSQQNTMYDEEPSSTNLYSQESMMDSSFPMSNCEAVSPASSVPSYLNKNLNSMDANLSHSSFEIHPLIVNLLLSDSLLNIFKDHNFDCCCLCVCNMNIKGSDAGIILPNTLIPTWNDEPQYKCTCGFSAVVHRHRSYNSGLFYEDELEVTGSVCDIVSNSIYSTTSDKLETEQSESQKITFQMENIPGFVLDILKIQCKNITSPFSLFHKFRLSAKTENQSYANGIEMSDGREICFMALEEARLSMENLVSSNKFDETLKSSCLHKWPYISSPLPSSSLEVRLHLESIKPLLQLAVHKKNTQRLWDVTYVVSGPLTWREFHRLAARGTEDQCEPQPIPSLLLGHDKDSVALSPFALKHWDKLHLEPSALPRDVAYIVVAPENDLVLSAIKSFFRELSCTYETHNLGKHRPITKVLRDGIMRVGKTAASKVAEEPVSEWFNTIGDGPISNKLKLYARVCKHRLAPHLSTLSLDNSIFNPPKLSESTNSTSSSTHFSENAERSSIPKHVENEYSTETHPTTSHDSSEDNDHDIPALVIYVVEPFTYGQSDPDVYRLISLGIMYSYADMLSSLPEATKNAIHLQILSLDSIMCHGGNKIKTKRDRDMKQRKDKLKALALSVYSQSYLSSTHQHTAKSLTGFGPAAAQDKFISNRSNKVFYPMHVYNQPYVIASVKDKQTELGEMFGDRREKCGVLYCSYCLTKDRKYILACCTNDKGEFTETTVINIGIPNRHRRKQCSVRKFGLRKLLEFILEVISVSVHPWRIIIDRFGRLGHGELKAWASLLNRKSLQSYSKHLRDMCNQCNISGIGDGPSILSACLVSLGPDSALRIMHDQFTPDDRFSSSRYKTCCLSTPEDATCTHILVFPTSAITQSSHSTFHQEHIDPLPGDLFETLDDDDLPGPDMNDIFRWTESPPSAGNSPRRDGCSQPSSPGSSFRLSSSNQGEQNKCENILTESQDETLQLLQQPLALGYYVSTAKVGPVPKWFWASCPQQENKLPVFLKSALLIHLPFIPQSSDDWLPNNNQQQLLCHPLDSNFTTDVLRYVLEGYNALSWLQLDSKYSDRRSCLPIHMQILMQLYGIVETIL